MYLIVGLGNYGMEYENTFHNMGFMTVDILAEKLGVRFKKKECEALVAEAYIKGEKIIIAKPQTYMNNSGRAVKQLLNKYKLTEENLCVIYDDYDLVKGVVRIRPSGSAGTHNGMRSVIGETGLKNFTRIRIGIKDENVDIPIINYVLSRIRSADDDLFYQAFDRASDAAKALAGGLSVELTMTKYNG
ncbi:MAG: aminoacyl-tRNA hydrolase [Clostridia bacterium]|nr:aminoacyl-tRNA hydrolase [Clostridia bacterium]